MERKFWIGVSSEGNFIIVMNTSEIPPKEFKSVVVGLNGCEKVYRNFKAISKEEVLLRQKEAYKKIDKIFSDREICIGTLKFSL